jgi:multidrug efflux pump subunit AcrA (membrane-fusion protein)
MAVSVSVEWYRESADICAVLADQSLNPFTKAAYRELTSAWLLLVPSAEQLARRPAFRMLRKQRRQSWRAGSITGQVRAGHVRRGTYLAQLRRLAKSRDESIGALYAIHAAMAEKPGQT